MTKQISYLSLFTAFAIVLSYVEILIPFNFGIPGVKLGLANFIILLALYYMGIKQAILINVARIIIIGFLFGNLFSILFSLSGAIFSLFFMFLIKKTKMFSIVSVSVIGGIMHNVGQLVIAAFVVETYSILYYIPILIIAGLITGLLLGIVTNLVKDKIKYILRQV